ncbi:hypothetical protein L4G92_01200 [Neisseria sp. ZJ106]|uniref:Uncharacterized protein n=1 Tax=Neisseria lisongii TaxID=2912188 RepID=A0ABY7RJY1_9NEIS|nr:hypothetical protein [Neisseria lisongii]MCF7520672.1 hypothetical protein [Neisseria lisongii]WCL71395.1 hypothetical protein PJU73_08725 [Neisseria lisongii]
MNNSLDFFTMGQYFLNLAIASSEELIKSGNPYVTVTNNPSSYKEYQYTTRWADHNIGVPILFNFYHGIELMLKGTILHQGKSIIKEHKFSELVEQIQTDEYTKILLDLVKSVTSKIDLTNPLAQFFKNNNITSDQWYIALKYPENNQQSLSHYDLKYGGEQASEFWQSINKLSKQILKISEMIYSSIPPQATEQIMPPES